MVERFACGLAALGIRKGDRVALCLPNTPQAVIAYFGILRAGGIVVACNPTYTEYELAHQLRDSGARAIVVLDSMYQKIQHLKLELVIVTQDHRFHDDDREIYLSASKWPPSSS